MVDFWWILYEDKLCIVGVISDITTHKEMEEVNIVEEITLSVAQYIEGKGLTLLFDTDIEGRLQALSGHTEC